MWVIIIRNEKCLLVAEAARFGNRPRKNSGHPLTRRFLLFAVRFSCTRSIVVFPGYDWDPTVPGLMHSIFLLMIPLFVRAAISLSNVILGISLLFPNTFPRVIFFTTTICAPFSYPRVLRTRYVRAYIIIIITI